MKYMSIPGFRLWFSEHWKPMLITLLFFNAVFYFTVHTLDQRNDDRRQAEQLTAINNAVNRIIDQNKGQTKTLTDQDKRIEDLQKLSICLSQFVIGGNFTDKEECQRRVSQGFAGIGNVQASQGAKGSSGNKGNRGNSGNNPNPPINEGLLPDDVPILGGIL